MLRFLIVLIVTATYSTSSGQDIFASIDSRYAPKRLNVFFNGDSAFIRIVHPVGATGAFDAFNGWYYNNQKVADVNLPIKKEEVAGLQKYGDTIYYYGYSNKGKNSVVKTLRSVNYQPGMLVSEHELEGDIMGAKNRVGNVTIVTFDRKGKKVRTYDLRRDKLVSKNELTFNWDLEKIMPDDISFVSPNVSELFQLKYQSLKIFLDGNTLALVFDDTFHDAKESNDVRRTLVIRKDLVTGKQEADGFRVTELINFISYLDGHLLYRITPGNDDWKLTVHDLDANTVVYQLDLAKLDDNNIYQRSVAAGTLENHNYNYTRQKVDKETWRAYRSKPIDIGLSVDSFGAQKIVRIGFLNSKRDIHLLNAISPTTTIVRGIVGRNPDPFLWTYNYLVGTATDGFQPVPSSLNVGLKSADEFEINIKDAPDYSAYSTQENCFVGVYNHRKSTVYTFVKFPNRH